MRQLQISLCVLLYGDFPQLSHRCLSSIWDRLEFHDGRVRDIRLGLNAISPESRKVAQWFAANAAKHYQIPVITYDSRQNACKYPLMRRMLLNDSRQPAAWVMWFDDDSYLDGAADWWSRLDDVASRCDMVGKVYSMPLRGKQWQWIQQQEWFNPAVGTPPIRRGKPVFLFATGGWWLVRYSVFSRWNWPTPQLKHCGGDSMLGELLRQQGLKLQDFDIGVRINADDRGRHSKAAPRGESKKRELLGLDGRHRDKDSSLLEVDRVEWI